MSVSAVGRKHNKSKNWIEWWETNISSTEFLNLARSLYILNIYDVIQVNAAFLYSRHLLSKLKMALCSQVPSCAVGVVSANIGKIRNNS